MAKEDSLKGILDSTRVRFIISSPQQQPHLGGEQQTQQTLKWWGEGVTGPGVEKDAPNLGHTIKTPSKLHANRASSLNVANLSLQGERLLQIPMERGTRSEAWGSFAGDRQQSHRLSIWGSLETSVRETSWIPAELFHSQYLSQTLFHQAYALGGEELLKFIARIWKSKIPNLEAVYQVPRLGCIFSLELSYPKQKLTQISELLFVQWYRL